MFGVPGPLGARLGNFGILGALLPSDVPKGVFGVGKMFGGPLNSEFEYAEGPPIVPTPRSVQGSPLHKRGVLIV